MAERSSTPLQPRWHQRRETGQGMALAIAEWVAGVFGRRAVHVLLMLAAAYYLAVRGAERRASRQFLSRALGRPATLRDSFRHFHAFARVAVDRVFLLAPRGTKIPLQVHGQELMAEALRQGRGCILLSAHLGSFEAARQAGLNFRDLQLRILLDRSVNRGLVETFERIDPQFAASILDAGEDPRALTLKIGESLRAGQWVGWLGDRFRGAERTVTCDFMGAPARFPASPFIIARLFKVPVFLVLACLTVDGYEIFVERLAEDADLVGPDREAFLREQVARFAGRLEHYARRFPLNWFNFYDFWEA